MSAQQIVTGPEYRFDVIKGTGAQWMIYDNQRQGYVATKRGVVRKFGIESNAIIAAVQLEFKHRHGEI